MTAERAVPGEAEWLEFSAPHLARYLFAADFVRGRRVLDAGTGCGYGARMLREGGADQVVGIDCDKATIGLAQARFGGEQVRFVQDDCQTMRQVSGPFDVICSFENIEHLQRPEQFLATAGARMAPEGVLLVSTPDRASTPPYVHGRPRNPYHTVEWYTDEFAALLQEHFHDVDLRTQVQATAVTGRQEAVAALRQGLTWCNPLAALLWRKFPFARRSVRPWKKLAWLAAPSVGDYPIVPRALAPLFGRSAFLVAVCRRPRPSGAGAGERLAGPASGREEQVARRAS